MVTYISSANAAKYNILFAKAADVLRNNPPEDRRNEFGDDFFITSISEYFAYLKDIVEACGTENVDIGRFFVRLPLDEEFFDIDINSRSIKIPNSFARNGVGVQGDELAEVVYFKVPRYFDSMDLANEDINIVIQWEARDAQRQTIRGISQHFGKDTETENGSIIFGWPISHDLTAAAGTIKFAVRFYQLSEGNTNQLLYSLSTLPAEVSINSSLNYDVISESKIDHGNIITSRISNSGIYDPYGEIPGEPIITTNLYVLSPEGNEGNKIVDLPDEGDLELAIGAKNRDFGTISYKWNRYAYNEGNGQYYDNPDFNPMETGDIESVRTEYQKISAQELNELLEQPNRDKEKDPEFYILTSSQNGVQASLINIEAAGIYVDEVQISDEDTEEIETVYIIKNADGPIDLYKKLSVAVITNVGQYAVTVSARAGANTVDRKMPITERITVPGPKTPIVNFPSSLDENISITTNMAHAITDDGDITLTVEATASEFAIDSTPEEVGANPQVTLEYTWKKMINDDKRDAIEIIDNSDETNDPTDIIYTINGNTLTISHLPEENLNDFYFCTVKATRNGVDTSKDSELYRVTNSPKAPVLKYAGADVDRVIRSIEKYDARQNPRTLSFDVEPPTLSDDIIYLWMHSVIDNAEDYYNSDPNSGNIVAQINLNGALNSILRNDVETQNSGAPDEICNSNVARYEDDMIVFGADSGSNSYQLTDDSEGIYYCIVINELNNNKTASVGPFFHVS